MKKYAELKGDGGSRIVEQITSQKKEINRRLAQVKNILAIGSGKGGVGKSTLVMRIACALVDKGLKVAIIDADINGPCQARLGGIQHAHLFPGSHGMLLPKTSNGIGIFSFANLFSEEHAVEFNSVVRGDSQTWRATREFSALAEVLSCTDWGVLDYLLIDLPPGAERTLQYMEFFGPRTQLVLVTIPSALARGVVSRSIDALRRTPNKILGYVENMAGYYCKDCDEIKALFPDSDDIEIKIPCLGKVPFDPELAKLCDMGLLSTAQQSPNIANPVALIAESILQNYQNKEEIKDEISVC